MNGFFSNCLIVGDNLAGKLHDTFFDISPRRRDHELRQSGGLQPFEAIGEKKNLRSVQRLALSHQLKQK